MKSAIAGLRKRESYDELINDLSHDPINQYPDRTATQLENSNYLSQLRGGFEEMILQNDMLAKEKHKELLLQEQAGSGVHGLHEHVINEGRWRNHVPPSEPAAPEPEEFHTPIHTPLHIPVGQPRSYVPLEPPIQLSETRSRSNRKARQRNTPLIQEVEPDVGPIHFEIGSPNSRSARGNRRAKFNLAHDVDSDAEEAHNINVDDEEMNRQRDEELRQRAAEAARHMMGAAQNHGIEDVMTGRGDKRREENADPKPAKPKAKSQPKKANSPKKDDSPESSHEAKGKRGRPKS